jgi:hypothetical protein
MNWDLVTDVLSEKDRLDRYPIYEVNISKNGDVWTPGTYAVDFIESMGEYPLMVRDHTVSSENSPEVFKKIHEYPWVRNFNDKNYPLAYTPVGSTTPIPLGFEDNTIYSVRVRAYSHSGSITKKGAWSETQAVEIRLLKNILLPPIVVKTYSPALLWYPSSTNILIEELFNGYFYWIYYQVDYENNGVKRKLTQAQKDSIKLIEIEESEFENFSIGRGRPFYLNINNPASFSILGNLVWLFKRSPIDSMQEVNPPEFGKTYYYRARFLQADAVQEVDLNTPDRLNDTRPGQYSQTVKVVVPQAIRAPGAGGASSSKNTWHP